MLKKSGRSRPIRFSIGAVDRRLAASAAEVFVLKMGESRQAGKSPWQQQLRTHIIIIALYTQRDTALVHIRELKQQRECLQVRVSQRTEVLTLM